MSRIITANRFSFTPGDFNVNREKGAKNKSRILSMNEKKKNTRGSENLGGARLSLVSACFILVSGVMGLGAYYLYQVNDLATKTYEMKDMETKIQELQKESKRMQIKEVELRSMYNLEKETENLDLVNAQNVTYVEMKSPVAMK